VLKFLLLLPLSGAFLIALLPARRPLRIRAVAAVVAALNLGLSLALAASFDEASPISSSSRPGRGIRASAPALRSA